MKDQSDTQTVWFASWSLSTLWIIGTILASPIVQALTVPATLGVHDPSRLIEDNGSYYFYGTSSDITGYYTSNNGASWQSTGPLLKNGVPANVIAVVPQNNGKEIWALT